jgi:hypothetical protein
MRGAWLTAIARRVLRDQTFHLIAAPAIADLQFEGGARHYAAIWWVIVRALLHDMRSDVATSFGATARASVWPQTLTLFALLFTVMTFIALGNRIRLRAPDGTISRLPWPPLGDGLEPLLAGLLVSMALAAAGYATLTFSFALRRRHAPARTVLVGTLCLAAFVYGAARATRPLIYTAELYRSAAIARSGIGAPASRPLSEIVGDDTARRRTGLVERPDMWQQFARWREQRAALTVLVSSLLGATLARWQGLGVLLRAVAILATANALRGAIPWLTVLFWPANSPRPSPTLEQLPAFLMLPLVTVAFLAFDLFATRRRRAAA